MIRLILASTFLLLWGTIGQIIYFIIYLLGLILGNEFRDKSMLSLIKFVSRCLFFICGTEIEIVGIENIPSEVCLFVPNHRSNFDPLLIYLLVKSTTGMIAKKELTKVPFVGMWIKALHGYLIDRDDIRQSFKVIIDAIDSIKNGISICIFPEGTRCKCCDKTETLEFKEGSFKIAQKSNSIVLPVAIYNSSNIFEDHKPWIKACKVKIKIAKGFKINDLNEEEQKKVGEYTRNIIISMLKEIECNFK